ncbi:MAG: glutathione S-transferase family protein [Celeribacter sp.]|jgi:glutathione S-transferase
MKIDLFYAPKACSLVPYLLLEEAAATYEVHVLNLRGGEQNSAQYLALNPKHKVPLLVVDGKPLSENLAIQMWIAHSFPEAQLLPQDPWKASEALSLLSWCASGFHPPLSRVNSPDRYCGAESPAATVAEIAMAQLREQFSIAEDLLDGRSYLLGDFSVADAYFFWCYRRADQLGVDLGDMPRCRAHFETVAARPSAISVLDFEAQVLRGG